LHEYYYDTVTAIMSWQQQQQQHCCAGVAAIRPRQISSRPSNARAHGGGSCALSALSISIASRRRRSRILPADRHNCAVPLHWTASNARPATARGCLLVELGDFDCPPAQVGDQQRAGMIRSRHVRGTTRDVRTTATATQKTPFSRQSAHRDRVFPPDV